MKTFAHFDSVGSIHSFVTVDAPDGVTAMVESEPGMSVAELDAPEVEAAAGDPEKLRDVAKIYRIATPYERLYKLTKT